METKLYFEGKWIVPSGRMVECSFDEELMCCLNDRTSTLFATIRDLALAGY